MAKIFALIVLGAILLTSSHLSARDYKTTFHVTILIGHKEITSDCANKKDDPAPISTSLKAKGWICKLTPRQPFNEGEDWGQSIYCVNTINKSIVSTMAHCAVDKPDHNESMFMLDDIGDDVENTDFEISCQTVGGERI